MGEIPRQLSVDDVNMLDEEPQSIRTDDYALDGRRYGVPPQRTEFERLYGEEGVGWSAIETRPEGQAEKLGHNMGLTILKVVITPLGQEYARSQQRVLQDA